MPEIEIRTADESDLPAVRELLAETVSDATSLSWVQSRSTRVACLSSRVVGIAVVDRTFFGNAFVQMLRVKDDNRRQGIGGALIRDLAHHRTTEKLFTSTNLSNHPMQTLLSKLGWESAGIVYGLDDGDPELLYRAPTKTVQ
jgi:ribosomal protein S18 acetylase RimI-like enzyme